jgi:L-2-hydroxyglutarate oxidase
LARNFDLVIIGGGILGTSISYFLSHLNNSKQIAVIEQEHNVAFHTSGRNTGKVHAPYLYAKKME